MQERIEGLRKSVAGDGQRLVAPKNWIGSESVNLFQVVCDLLDLVRDMNTQIAEHTQAPYQLPNNATSFTLASVTAKQQVAKLKEITAQ